MKFFLMLLMVGLWGEKLGLISFGIFVYSIFVLKGYSHGQVLNLQTDCGRGTASLNRIMGGTVAEKGRIFSKFFLKIHI